MLKRFVGTRAISVMDVPAYMNEYDELEDIFFGNKKIQNKMEEARLKGLYEYLWWLKPPKTPSVHAPYNILAYLAKVAPKGSEADYVAQKLHEYGYLKQKETSPSLEERIEYVQNWNRDFLEIKETSIKLSVKEKQAIIELIETLKTEKDAEDLQSVIFDTARKHSLQPAEFFKTLYTILLGTPKGPRLGPYIIAMGAKNVVEALQRATEK
jgi:lysyl-tRNA synthetase class 1